MDNNTETAPAPTPAENVTAFETLASSLMKRIPKTDEVKWRMEQPERGYVFTPRRPDWQFSDAGNFSIGVHDQHDTPITLKMEKNAYVDFMALAPATQGMDETDYVRLLCATAIKIGAYRGLLDAAAKVPALKNDPVPAQMTAQLDIIQKQVEDRIHQESEAIGADHIPLSLENVQEIIAHTAQAYTTGIAKSFTPVNQR